MLLNRVRVLLPSPVKRRARAWATRRRLQRGDDIAIVFNEIVGRGSAEHYYHFLWGYLLPGLWYIRASGLKGRFILQDFGPVMNPLWEEMADLLDLDIRFRSGFGGRRAPFTWTLPRWDTFLSSVFEGVPQRSRHPLSDLEQRHLQLTDPVLWQAITRPGGLEDIGRLMRALRDDLLPMLQARAEQEVQGPPGDAEAPAPYLILKRSEEHSFYREGGSAQVKQYGASRRSIVDLDESIAALRARGYPVAAFECGAHSLAGQARAFASCRGLAMIRGAEVANFVWLAPGAKAHVICPPMGSRNKPHDGVAAVFGIDVTEQATEDMHARLDIDAVASAWGPPPGHNAGA
jgi:hypothetical protein